jgi:hypothetical protein
MAKAQRNRAKDSQNDQASRDPYDKDPYDQEPHDKEPFDDPDEHIEIERRRFQGGEPPTPELYARAREQWHRLPGAVAKPPMGEEGVDTGGDAAKAPTQGKKNDDGGER